MPPMRITAQFPTLPSPKHLTDIYLLGLAIVYKAKLATLDQRIEPRSIPGGAKAYFLIP